MVALSILILRCLFNFLSVQASIEIFIDREGGEQQYKLRSIFFCLEKNTAAPFFGGCVKFGTRYLTVLFCALGHDDLHAA